MDYFMALIHRQLTKTINLKSGIKEVGIDICSCDICSKEYEQRICDTIFRRSGKLANGRDLCKDCSKLENSKNRAKCGTEALARQSTEKRKENASKAGKISAEKYNPEVNKSRFSTERWDEKSDEEKKIHVTRANKGLQEKLKDPIYAAQHYAKIFAQTKIGYQSKGHKDLHSLIQYLGFESHVQIDRMQVDECNIDLKIVIEYNGDMWHCNPRHYKADDYNSAIRMTAGEKWAKDIARHSILRKMGYRTVTIWESDWIENAAKCIDKIKGICDEISEQKRNSN